MSDFRNTYNEMLKKRGGNISNGVLNTTQKYVERHFKDDPSYRMGLKMQSPQNMPIDFRFSNAVGNGNMDRNTDIKKIIFRPNADIDSGDYIINSEEHWLLTECEKNNVVPRTIAYNCNNKLRLLIGDNIVDIYGYFASGTFVIKDGELVKIDNTKITCIIGTYYRDIIRNNFKETKTRFIIDGKAWIIDTIDSITGINYECKGVYNINLRADVLSPFDDLENNLAFNDDIKKEDTQFISIYGKDKIIKNNQEEYKTNIVKEEIIFKLDDWTIKNNVAKIISQKNSKCIIEGLVFNEQIILSVYDGNNKLCDKVIWIGDEE